MGTTPIAWNIPKTDTSTLNVNLTGNRNSVGSEVAGSLASIGTMLTMGLLSNAIQNKGKQTPTDTKAPNNFVTQQADMETAIAKINIDISKNQKDVDDAQKAFTDYTTKTDSTQIDQKQKSVDDLEAIVYGTDDGKDSKEASKGNEKSIEIAKEITQKQSAYDTCNTIATKAQTDYTATEGKYQSLNDDATNMEAGVGNDPGDPGIDPGDKADSKTVATYNEKKEAKATYDENKRMANAKRQEATAAKTQMDQLKIALDAANKNKAAALTELNTAKGTTVTPNGETTVDQSKADVATKLEQLKKEQAELAEMKALQGDTDAAKTKATLVNKLGTARTNLEASQKLLSVYKAQQLKMKGSQSIQNNKDADKYATTGGKNDGNWWSRNMPSFLGGANKATKAQYKTNHQAYENSIAEYATDNGISDSQAKADLDKKATETATDRATQFKTSNPKSNISNKKLIQYFKDNPDATDAQAKDLK